MATSNRMLTLIITNPEQEAQVYLFESPAALIAWGSRDLGTDMAPIIEAGTWTDPDDGTTYRVASLQIIRG